MQNHHAIYMHVTTDEKSDQCNDRTSEFQTFPLYSLNYI